VISIFLSLAFSPANSNHIIEYQRKVLNIGLCRLEFASIITNNSLISKAAKNKKQVASWLWI